MTTTTTIQHQQQHTVIRVKRQCGFASMTEEKRRRIASLGGFAAQRSGKAHRWTVEEAQAAGRKGGTISRRRRKGTPLNRQSIGSREETKPEQG